jgi:hypothetical protein
MTETLIFLKDKKSPEDTEEKKYLALPSLYRIFVAAARKRGYKHSSKRRGLTKGDAVYQRHPALPLDTSVGATDSTVVGCVYQLPLSCQWLVRASPMGYLCWQRGAVFSTRGKPM